MNKKIKNNINKQTLFAFVLGALLFGTIGVGASTLLSSSDVTYDNSSSGLSSTNLQDALDELYEQAKTGGATVTCDDNGNCTVTCKQGEPTITDSGYSCATSTSVTCPSGTYYYATATGYKCTTTRDLLMENVVTSGDGLYADSYESGRYVYKGASPNNYITFSGSTWRILAIESDGTLKIMKENSIGSMAYDSNYSKTWSSATLKTYLNGTYYNTLDSTYIQNYSFNVGGTLDISSLTTTISQEKRTKWTGKIALATVSDYVKSNTNTSSCGSINGIRNNYSTCKTSSFIGKTMSSSNPWLLSLDASETNEAWYVRSDGYSSTDAVANSSSHGVLPVLYLSSSIALTGSGTSTDPYQITG